MLFSFCQGASDDKLGVGRLAHQGAIFLKLSQEGIEMERELFMGSYFRFVIIAWLVDHVWDPAESIRLTLSK